jgi:hypothetical protein
LRVLWHSQHEILRRVPFASNYWTVVKWSNNWSIYSWTDSARILTIIEFVVPAAGIASKRLALHRRIIARIGELASKGQRLFQSISGFQLKIKFILWNSKVAMVDLG